jgi:hypothetical protein
MNVRSQLVCAWSALISLVLLFVGFFLVTGYVPPPHASDSAQQISRFYLEHTSRLRIGLLITLVAWAGWGPLVAALSVQIARIEGPRPVLAILQGAAGTVGWVFLVLPTIMLAVVTFRPGRSPEVTQTLHDLAWIVAFMAITPFIVQALAVGAAILQDRSERPVFPRWLGYFNLWAAVLFAPGGLLIFFKTGPFSYQGLFVFWIPFIVFGAWIGIMAWWVRRAALNERALVAGAERSAPVAAVT